MPRPTRRSPSWSTRPATSASRRAFRGTGARPSPGRRRHGARWIDGLGADSPHDYDPLWQRCVELGVAPTFHCDGDGLGEPDVADELRRQPHRKLRGRGRALARRCSSAACRCGSPSCASRSSRAASRGPRTCAPISSATSRSASPPRVEPRPRALDREALVGSSRLRRRSVPRTLDELEERCRSSPAGRASRVDRRVRAAGSRTRGRRRRLRPPFLFGCEADDPIDGLAFDAGAIRRAAFGRCSAPTSGTGTCPTSGRCSPRRGSSSRTALSTGRVPRVHVREPRVAVGGSEPAVLRRHGGGRCCSGGSSARANV